MAGRAGGGMGDVRPKEGSSNYVGEAGLKWLLFHVSYEFIKLRFTNVKCFSRSMNVGGEEWLSLVTEKFGVRPKSI